MAIDVIREAIDVERLMGENNAQALVEGSVLIPGSGREAMNVLYTDAKLALDSVEVQSERVAMDGQALFNVIYTQGTDPSPKQVEAAISFNHAVDIPGAGPRMLAKVVGEIEHAEAQVIGGRLTLKAVVNLRVRVTFPTQVMAITEITGVDCLQVQTMQVNCVVSCGNGEKKASVREEFELPYGMEPIDVLIGRERVRIDRVAAGEGMATVSGEIIVDSIYSLESDRLIQKTRHSVPFEEEINLPGAFIGARIRAEATMDNTEYTLMRDTEKTFLSINGLLVIKVSCEETRECTVIRDAYTTALPWISLKAGEISVPGGTAEYEGSDSVKASLPLPENAAPVANVLATFVRPVISNISTTDTRTEMEGILDISIIYMPLGEEMPASLSQETPFHAAFDFALPGNAWYTLNVDDAEAMQITSERLELKCLLRLHGTAALSNTVIVALEVEEQEGGEALPGGITLYFAQPGEDAWAVAKRFAITQEDIARQNPGIKEINEGACLLLYKRKIPV